MGTALITGATAGIGHAYAQQLAAQGMNLVLVARNGERLNELAQELQKNYSISVEVLIADLTNKSQVAEVACRAAAQDIELVINTEAANEDEGSMFDPNNLSILPDAKDALPTKEKLLLTTNGTTVTSALKNCLNAPIH
jgi:NADP-dependent 3-hydroxy acid dehydrogenase YdfG